MNSIPSSPFFIEKDTEHITLINHRTSAKVQIVPEWGGIMNSFTVGDHSLIEGYQSKEEFIKTRDHTFKSAKLSPFPNRVKNGIYRFNGSDFQLPINFPGENNSIHGFLWDKPFKILNTEASMGFSSATLEHISEPIPGFPFRFRLRVCYKLLRDNSLICTSQIMNLSNEAMPYGDGFHCYFTLNKSLVDNWFLELDGALLLQEKAEPLGYFTLDTKLSLQNIFLDHCFAVNKPEVTLSDEQGNSIQLYLCRLYKYLQVYIPPSRKSIALEPMSCPPYAFNSYMDLKVLKPGEKVSYDYTIIPSFAE